MPKDPARNQPNYKIGGGQLNEFEYAREKGAMTEAEHEHSQEPQGEGGEQSGPQTEAERNQQLMADVHERVQRRKEKEHGAAQASGGKSSAKRGAGAAAGAKKGAGKSGAQSAQGASAGRKTTGAQKGAGGTKGGSKKGARKSAR